MKECSNLHRCILQVQRETFYNVIQDLWLFLSLLIIIIIIIIIIYIYIQVSQLGTVAQKYQSFTQNATPNVSVPELQNNCNM